jgi:hypothetical protein
MNNHIKEANMTKNLKVILFYFVLLTLFLLLTWVSVPVSAEEKSVKNIANVWLFVPKPGQIANFEQAFIDHIAYRKLMKDPRSWSVYQADMGANMDAYIVRSCCNTWSELDDYRQWNIQAKASENWRENVSKYISHYEHHRAKNDLNNSHWPADVTYKYIGVNTYQLKLGHSEALEKDKKIISDAAKKENWPYNWLWYDRVNGKLAMSLAIPYTTYGAMAPPEIKFSKLLAKHLDSPKKAKKVLQRWSSHFDEISYNIYILREDLSM